MAGEIFAVIMGDICIFITECGNDKTCTGAGLLIMNFKSEW